MLDQGVLSVEDIEHFKSVMDKKASLVSRSLSFLSNSESRRFAEKRRAAKVKKRRSYDLIVDNLIKSVEGKGKESKRAIYAFGDGDFASSKKGISGTAFHLQIRRRTIATLRCTGLRAFQSRKETLQPLVNLLFLSCLSALHFF